MKRILIICLAICAMFYNVALAQESQKVRADKTIFLGITPVGIHIPTLVAPPVGIGFYLGDSWLFGIESGSKSLDQDDGDTKSSADFSNQGIYARWFTGNSFNILFAVHQRNWKASAVVTKSVRSGFTIVTESATADLEAKATVATIGIGNQWSFGWGLVLGADWALGSALLSSSSTATITANGFSNTQDAADAEKDLTEFGDFLNKASSFPGVLNLTIGFAF